MVGGDKEDVTLASEAGASSALGGDPVEAYKEVLAALARKRGECVAAIQRIDLAKKEIERTFRAALQAAVAAVDWPKLSPPDLSHLDEIPASSSTVTAEDEATVPRHAPPRPTPPSVPIPQPGSKPYGSAKPRRRVDEEAPVAPPTSRHEYEHEHEHAPKSAGGRGVIRAGTYTPHGALIDILRPAIYDIVRGAPGIKRPELVNECARRFPKLPGGDKVKIDTRNRIQRIVTTMVAADQLKMATTRDGNAMYLGKAAPRSKAGPPSSPSMLRAVNEG
jgi:hypothetical protein